MELKKGYKKTEVGSIPEDWDCDVIREEFASIDSDNLKSDTPLNYRFQYISLENVNKGRLSGTLELNYKDAPSRARRKLKKGDVLIGTVRPNLMSHYYVKEDVKDLICSTGFCVVRAYEDKFSGEFLYHHLFGRVLNEQIDRILVGSNYPAINNKDIKKLLLPIPSLTEQKAIAKALSDIDALIISLTKLIDKKKNIKQGAMQELLTGKKRLEGFSKDWTIETVGALGKAYGGLTGKNKEHFGQGNSRYIPFMNIMSNPIIDTEYLEFVQIKSGEYQNSARCGDLFFNTSSETPEEVGMCSVLLDDIDNLFLNSFCFGFRLNDLRENNPLFLSYLFRSNIGRNLMFSLAQGATRYNLSKNNFYKLEIKIPKYEEQSSIASILSDMDAEIEKLNYKLNKYRSIKQGMMQELLTGRIRLIEEGIQ